MKNNFLRLIKVQQSIEIPSSAEQDFNKNFISPQISPQISHITFPDILSQKQIFGESRPTTGESSLQKSKLSPRNYKKCSSLEYSQNLDDSFNDGTIQKKVEMRLIDVKFPFPVISPFGTFIKIWNSIILLVMVYVITVFPVRLGFIDDTLDWAIFDLLVDSIFMFDMVVNTLTAYEDLNGNLVFHLHKIALNYLQKWFFLDLISSLPFNLILEGSNDIAIGSTTPNIYKVTKVFRLFRLAKMSNYYTRIFINFRVSKETLQLSKMIISMLFLLHITSCLWIMIAKIEDNPETWISYYDLIDADEFTLYIASIYFILTVLITLGYGNITATTTPEKAFISVFMFLGIGCFGFLLGTLNQIFQKKVKLGENKEMFFIQIGKILKIPQKTLSKILIRNKKLHVSNLLTKISSLRRQDIFKDLPFSLQESLYSFIYKDLLEKIEFFHDKPFSFLNQILPKLTPTFLKKGDEVFREGDVANDVYFIMKGRVVSKCLDTNEKIKTVIFMEGGYFGEADIIYKRQRHETALAESDAEIWKLDKKPFLKALKSFKEIKGEVKKLANEKFRIRKASAFNFKSLPKYLMPATYFISKIKGSDKKSTVDGILRKSVGALDERKKLQANFDNSHKNLDLRTLFLKNETMKAADKNQITETTSEEIEEFGFQEVLKFLFRNHINLMDEDLKIILKIAGSLNNKKEILNNRKLDSKSKKIDEILSILINLYGILASQEDELLATLKLTED